MATHLGTHKFYLNNLQLSFGNCLTPRSRSSLPSLSLSPSSPSAFLPHYCYYIHPIVNSARFLCVCELGIICLLLASGNSFYIAGCLSCWNDESAECFLCPQGLHLKIKEPHQFKLDFFKQSIGDTHWINTWGRLNKSEHIKFLLACTLLKRVRGKSSSS